VVTLGKLAGFVIVAARAVTRRHDRRDLNPVVQIAVGILERRLMALHTPHTLLGVGAALPVRDDARVLFGVTFHALLRARWDGYVRRPETGLLRLARCLHPLNQHQREEEQAAESGDNDALGLKSH
jgi:hypothetical protein